MEISKELDGKKVTSFLYIDRMNEGFGTTFPEDNQTFFFSHEYHGDHAENFVVVKYDGKIQRIVNVIDLASIDFEL